MRAISPEEFLYAIEVGTVSVFRPAQLLTDGSNSRAEASGRHQHEVIKINSSFGLFVALHLLT